MNVNSPLLYEGSVKNIRGVEGSAPYIFEYSDRYSIFDWGAMPDLIKEKGDSLATMAWEFFTYLSNGKNFVALRDWQVVKDLELEEELEEIIESGISHHALGLLDSEGNIKNSGKSNYLAVTPVAVLWPEEKFENAELVYDYSAYTSRPLNSLVPLEVIFRFGLPKGSSLLKRLKDNDYCKSCKIDQSLKEGDYFDGPIVEFSSKLESLDRYLNYEDAKNLASLSDCEFKKLHKKCLILALCLKDIFAKQGIKLWDGKFEFAFAGNLDAKSDRNFTLVDSIGPDELRLTFNDVQLSKENLRKFYRGSDWAKSVDEAKKLASERGESNWKSICLNELQQKPQKLDPEKIDAIELMYKELTNAVCVLNGKEKVFGETQSFDKLIEKFK